jgi:hypothetical protein
MDWSDIDFDTFMGTFLPFRAIKLVRGYSTTL